jgi:hypothetical protein
MSDLLIQAMTAKQSGDITLAKQLLSQAIIQNPRNEGAWMLMSEVVEDVKLRRNCLERVLAINPGNAAANIALTRLNTSPLGPVIRGERNKPLDQPKLEKTPPFTPPFTWNGEPEQYLALGDLTFPDLTGDTGDNVDHLPETPLTFDWATDSDEPEKTIEKLFDAVSKPELASEPPPDNEPNWLDNLREEQTESITGDEPEIQNAQRDQLVSEEVIEPQEQQPENPDDFSVSAEPQLGMEAFASTDQPTYTNTEPSSLLWDNPNTPVDRLIILSHKSIIYANPIPSDIPHIMGLFNENKMVRDLLGENAGVIKLESIQRITINPKRANLRIDYQPNDKEITHELIFSSPQVRDEALTALSFRLVSDFKRTIQTFSMGDKIISPILVIILVAALVWGLIGGVPLLNTIPSFQSGTIQIILSALQRWVTTIGAFYLILLAGLIGLVCVLWLVNNLKKPSNLVILERR